MKLENNADKIITKMTIIKEIQLVVFFCFLNKSHICEGIFVKIEIRDKYFEREY